MHVQPRLVLNPQRKMESRKAISLIVYFLLIFSSSRAQDDGSESERPFDYGSGSGDIQSCPMDRECADLPARCISCDFNTSCVYGQPTSANCSAYDDIMCEVHNVTGRIFIIIVTRESEEGLSYMLCGWSLVAAATKVLVII